MVIRFSLVFITMILAIISLFLAAKHPTGPNTVSFDEPVIFWVTVGIIVILFLPPLILSLFNNLAVKIISAVYQSFIALSFLFLIPVGLMIPSLTIVLVGAIATIVCICSVIVTLLAGRKGYRQPVQ